MHIPRILDLGKILKEKSCFLLGPRQTGKTSFINTHFQEYKNYNLLKSEIFQKFSIRPQLLREEVTEKDKIVIIDEIQRIPNLLNEVQILIEEKKVKFLLTGSSARKLRKEGVNLLGGRARTRYFHPFSFIELKEQFELNKALLNGLIPSIYFSNSPNEDLDAYIGNYLEQEIMAESLTRNLASFARALEVAALCNGEQINFNQLASDAQIPRSTLQNYFQILKDTLIINELPCWNKTVKRKTQSTSKFYFFDYGIVRRLQKVESIPPKSIIQGKAFESFIYHELRTYIDYKGSGELHYWRTQDKHEVDFIYNNKVAIEIKATELVQDKHLKGLVKLKEEGKLKKYIVVSLDKTPRKPLIDSKIEILPWELFLQSLWAGEFDL
ncbi:MAG: AAA family ATPase [Bacteriovoracaceae bacterium]